MLRWLLCCAPWLQNPTTGAGRSTFGASGSARSWPRRMMPRVRGRSISSGLRRKIGLSWRLGGLRCKWPAGQAGLPEACIIRRTDRRSPLQEPASGEFRLIMEKQLPESALQKALKKFEATEANLSKLERLWDKAESLIPSGICFGDDPEYEEVCRSIEAIVQHLPKIDGWKPNIAPLELDVIAENRFDAQELGEPGVIVAMERAISEPGRLIREYRFRF